MTFMYSLFFLTLPGVLLPGVLGMPLGVGRSVAGLVQNMRLHAVQGAGAFPAGVAFTLDGMNPCFRVRPRLTSRHRGKACAGCRGYALRMREGGSILNKSRGKTAFAATG